MTFSKKATDPVATCHCRAVRIALKTAPSEVTDCNCSLCRRYGVLWAYVDSADADLGGLDGKTDTYVWNGRHVDFHHCRTCGCVTHWSPRDPVRNRLAVNARLLDPDILAAARVRYLDGANTGQYLD